MSAVAVAVAVANDAARSAEDQTPKSMLPRVYGNCEQAGWTAI